MEKKHIIIKKYNSIYLIKLNKTTMYLSKKIHLIECSTFTKPWTFENIKFEIGNKYSFSFALFINTKLIGYIFSIKTQDEIQINKICIHPKKRNKGFGTTLISKFIKKAIEQKSNTIYLEVKETNYAAFKLYQNAGFQKNRIRYKIYDDIENGIEMILNLS
jgi:[ribosomal protein S18]-alanine N-acetyltransferase